MPSTSRQDRKTQKNQKLEARRHSTQATINLLEGIEALLRDGIFPGVMAPLLSDAQKWVANVRENTRDELNRIDKKLGKTKRPAPEKSAGGRAKLQAVPNAPEPPAPK